MLMLAQGAHDERELSFMLCCGLAAVKVIYISGGKIMSVNSKKEILCYEDDNSDKFWRIEYMTNVLVVNYGKIGTIGKYQVKEFDTEEICEKEAKKLIASKIKKGYKPYEPYHELDWDNPFYDNHFYMDDPELGPHPLTSHPKFRANFTDGFYYDCTEEDAPFGSDEGADTLSILEYEIRKSRIYDVHQGDIVVFLIYHGKLELSDFPKSYVENDGSMIYYPPNDISREAVEELLKKDKDNVIYSDMVTYATAFA